MTSEKHYLRKKNIIQRKNKHFKSEKFNFNLIFKLIKKIFKKRKILVGAYYSSNYEVDILDFIKAANKKKIYTALPIIKSPTIMTFNLWKYKEPLNVSKFGTLEPNKFKKEVMPDLIIVPLVAFDNQLNRIGYGKGYYDRALKKINKQKKIISIGVAYSFQKCKKIPTNKYDHKLDYIFTERGIISSK